MIYTDKVLNERHNRKFRSNWPWESYYQKTSWSENLLAQINKKIKSRHCIQEARKQFIISYVTSFETYFKDSLFTLLKIYGNVRIIEEIKIKFDLSELEKILDKKISIEDIIASYFNFQELDQINKVFSRIFGVSFFDELKNREFSIIADLETFKIHKNFYKELKSFIDLRHEFVHDVNFKKNITQAQLDRYVSILAFFILGVDIYINEQIDEYKKKQKRDKHKS